MNDTIAAIATAPGEGGVSIVRISGPEAENVLMRVFLPKKKNPWPLESHRMTYGRAVDGAEAIDECMAVLMRAPRSYTREDVAELQLHGGVAVCQRALQACLRAGCRLAEPGEFTRRAFENGRLDLSQAEAVMGLIAARGEQARQAALRQLDGGASSFIRRAADELYQLQAALAACIDYPEEITEEEALSGLRPRMLALADTLAAAADERAAHILADGLTVALCGRPNVGKSSLLNALLREERAIVTAVPGTTRDIVRGEITLNGCPIRLADTAGLRDTGDEVEAVGVRLAKKAAAESDCVLLVLDGHLPLTPEDEALLRGIPSEGRDVIVLLNKADLPAAFPAEGLPLPEGTACLRVSARQPDSLGPLKEALARRAAVSDRLALTQPRHVEAARRAAEHLRAAAAAMDIAVDLASVDLSAAQSELASITGDQVEESLLDAVFSRFCVGK